jgi:hypothetical protein
MKKYRDLFVVLGAFFGLLLLGLLSPLIVDPQGLLRLPAVYTPDPQQKVNDKVITVTVLQSNKSINNCDEGCSLEQAIQYAPSGATIVFAAGVAGTISLQSDIHFDKDVTIIGPESQSESQKIILDGGWKGRLKELGSLRALEIERPIAVTLKNLTIRGFASRSINEGGAISNRGGMLTIENCTFESNLAIERGGGAVYNNRGTVIVKGSTFTQNQAGEPRDPRITSFTTLYRGGAIYNNGGSVTILDSSFAANTVSGDGGAIFNDQGSLIIQNSIFENNSSYFENVKRLPSIIASTTGNGGAVAASTGNITVSRSTFSANNATLNGGALYNSQANLSVNNSTFYENNAATGGALYNSAGKVIIKNTTLTGNAARSLFGGSNLFSFAGSTTVQNTILSTTSAAYSNCSGSVIDSGHNLQYPGNSCGLWMRSVDPLLDRYKPVKTYPRDMGALLIGLQSRSPAIDAGDNAVCSDPDIANVDQRGQARPLDGGTGQAVCDIGAFEYDPNTQ